jgi:hypothetical protein
MVARLPERPGVPPLDQRMSFLSERWREVHELRQFRDGIAFEEGVKFLRLFQERWFLQRFLTW